MAIFYLLAGTSWVVLWARAHEHTFKIHMVIGAIAVAGAMSNTLLFVNMASLNSTGQLSECFKLKHILTFKCVSFLFSKAYQLNNLNDKSSIRKIKLPFSDFLFPTDKIVCCLYTFHYCVENKILQYLFKSLPHGKKFLNYFCHLPYLM